MVDNKEVFVLLLLKMKFCSTFLLWVDFFAIFDLEEFSWFLFEFSKSSSFFKLTIIFAFFDLFNSFCNNICSILLLFIKFLFLLFFFGSLMFLFKSLLSKIFWVFSWFLFPKIIIFLVFFFCLITSADFSLLKSLFFWSFLLPTW